MIRLRRSLRRLFESLRKAWCRRFHFDAGYWRILWHEARGPVPVCMRCGRLFP